MYLHAFRQRVTLGLDGAHVETFNLSFKIREKSEDCQLGEVAN